VQWLDKATGMVYRYRVKCGGGLGIQYTESDDPQH